MSGGIRDSDFLRTFDAKTGQRSAASESDARVATCSATDRTSHTCSDGSEGRLPVEHLFGQLVHSEKLRDRELRELLRLFVVGSTANDLQAVAYVCHGIPDLVSQFGDETSGGH